MRQTTIPLCQTASDVVLSLFIVAITCSRLLFRTLSSADTGLWSVVNVTCPSGQRLNSSVTSIVTTCNSRGTWSPPVPDCIGMITVVQFLPARRCASAGIGYERVSVCVSVCHMVVLYLNGCTCTSWFWYTGFPWIILLHCILRILKFRQKLGHFRFELCPKFWTYKIWSKVRAWHTYIHTNLYSAKIVKWIWGAERER